MIYKFIVETNHNIYTIAGKTVLFNQILVRKLHRRRAAIEPIIGHIKQDHRLNRNLTSIKG